MIFEDTQRRWLDQALREMYSGKLTDQQVIKTLRIIGQVFEQRAKQIELELISRNEMGQAYDND
jgi:hypothetical protein